MCVAQAASLRVSPFQQITSDLEGSCGSISSCSLRQLLADSRQSFSPSSGVHNYPPTSPTTPEPSPHHVHRKRLQRTYPAPTAHTPLPHYRITAFSAYTVINNVSNPSLSSIPASAICHPFIPISNPTSITSRSVCTSALNKRPADSPSFPRGLEA